MASGKINFLYKQGNFLFHVSESEGIQELAYASFGSRAIIVLALMKQINKSTVLLG